MNGAQDETRELLVEFKGILHSGNQVKANAFIEKHKDKKLFCSLAKLQMALIPAIVEVWEKNGLLAEGEEAAEADETAKRIHKVRAVNRIIKRAMPGVIDEAAKK